MNLQNKQVELSNDKWQRRPLLWLSIVGTLVILLLWAVSGAVMYYCFGSDPAKLGAIGDMFGAINALFAGWAFLGVIVAIILQYFTTGHFLLSIFRYGKRQESMRLHSKSAQEVSAGSIR